MILIFFICAASSIGFTSSAVAPLRYPCLQGERWVECINACNTCKEKGRCPPGRPVCRRGCDCKPGFLRNEQQVCVPRSECGVPSRPKCALDEDYYECLPTCKHTCGTYKDKIGSCPTSCVSGCGCKRGLVRRNDKKCVLPENCQAIAVPETKAEVARCREDEVFVRCGTDCPPTCQDPLPDKCSEKCVPDCFCKPGLLRDRDGSCVLRPDCKPEPAPKCPENAVLIECGSPCAPTCADRSPEGCADRCVRACFCKPGYLRLPRGECVLPEQCGGGTSSGEPTAPPESKCPENAIFIECGSDCAPTCDNRDPDPSPCINKCSRGCFCKPGHLKRADDQCVLPKQCGRPQEQKCSQPDEEFLSCGPSCPDSCENRGQQPPSSCTDECSRGCFCKKGLLRSRDGGCVTPDACDREPDPEGEEFN